VNRIQVIIAITGFLGLLNGLQRYLLPIALITAGWDLQSYGYIYVVQALAVAIPMILGGISTDIKGRKSTTVVAFVTFSIGVTLFAYFINSESLLMLIVAQAVTTVSFGISRMALSIQMADETAEGDDRTRNLGLQAGLRNLMAFIGPLAFGFIFQNYELSLFGFADFEVGFFILAFFGIAGVLLSLLLPDTPVELLEKNAEVSITEIDEQELKMQKAFGVEEIILGFVSGLIVPFMDFYILTVFTPSDWEWGLLTALGNIGIASGSIIASRYAEGYGKAKTVVMFNLVVPLLATGIAFAPTFELISIFYVGRITVANLGHPIWESWYFSHISDNLRGRTWSIIQVSRRISRALGVAAGPMVYTTLGPISFPLACIFYPVAMLIPYTAEKRLNREIELEPIIAHD
jgi:MFS family permease